MQLSRHVVQTHIGETAVYYNTVTRKVLPIDSTEELLREHNFLADQEIDALRAAVLNQPIAKVLGFSIAPTWECNLRCTHCMVKHRLVEKQANHVDFDGVARFITDYSKTYGVQYIDVKFFGGESLLVVQDCIAILEAIRSLETIREAKYSLYTNLAMELTPAHIEFLANATVVGISIDGLEFEHNTQRLPYQGDWNPFQLTMANLKKLVLAGLKNNIEVQACLADEFNNHKIHKEFFRMILQYGIPPQRIRIGTIGPSQSNPIPGNHYLKGLATSIFVPTSCCKYRQHMLCTDATGGVYSDYYSYTKLGTIYDSAEHIVRQQEKLIEETAPALNDPKCQSCSVVGFCWGGCAVTENTGYRLSKYCSDRKQVLISRVADGAKLGTLVTRDNHNAKSLTSLH